MKKLFTLAFFCISLSVFAQTTYTGNGATGFGGPIGNSTLVISDNGSVITFQLTAPSFSGNALVIYVDSKTGGPANTSTFTDNADGSRTAISGLSGSGRALVNFPAGFNPDYAITLEPGVFGGLFNLSTPGNFGFVASTNLSGSGSSFTFTVAKADLGITGTPAFQFLGTLISVSAYRSNETIGNSTTIPGSVGDTPNAGFTGTQTFSNSQTYGSGTLPLKLISFSGRLVNTMVQLNWATANEGNTSHFIIENSSNSTTWHTVATVAANNTTAAQYAQTVTATAGSWLYRVKMVATGGAVTYSAISNVKGAVAEMALVSNPVKGAVRVAINADAGSYTATLYTLQGHRVIGLNYNHAGGAGTLQLPVANLAKGMYLLNVITAGATKSFQVVVE